MRHLCKWGFWLPVVRWGNWGLSLRSSSLFVKGKGLCNIILLSRASCHGFLELEGTCDCLGHWLQIPVLRGAVVSWNKNPFSFSAKNWEGNSDKSIRFSRGSLCFLMGFLWEWEVSVVKVRDTLGFTDFNLLVDPGVFACGSSQKRCDVMDSVMLCEGATASEFPKPIHPRILIKHIWTSQKHRCPGFLIREIRY